MSRIGRGSLVALCLAIGASERCWADKPRINAFRVPTAQALVRLAAVDATPASTTGADELQFLTDLHDGKLSGERLFAEAALWASGVAEPARRRDYLAKLDTIADEARAKVAAATTVSAKGEALLKLLHAGPMKGGYEAKQTSLSELLDGGKFNCVSSSALYNVVARRLGLNVRAVEIPGSFLAGHVYAVLDDGDKRIRVETTNSAGFAKGEVQIDGAKREVGDLGLAALIYSNRSSAYAHDKQYAEAARTGLGAVGLDPDSSSSANNALAAFVNWGNDLTKAGKYEESLKIIALGLDLAPTNSDLKNNYNVGWHEFAEAAMKAGDAKEAVARLRRAAKAVPDGGFLRQQGDLFILAAQKLTDAGKWKEAIALAESGMKIVDAEPAKRLADWRIGTYRQWSQSAMKKQDFEQAATALSEGLTALPGNKDLLNGVAYLGQEWLAAADAAKGPAGAVAAYEQMRKRYPEAKDLPEIARSHARRTLRKKADGGKFEEAIGLVAAYAPMLSGKKDVAEIGGQIYDGWARSLVKKDDFAGAVKVYREGLNSYPGEAMMTHNVGVFVDQWAEKARKANDATEVVRIYKLAVEQFPDQKSFRDRLTQAEKRAAK